MEAASPGCLFGVRRRALACPPFSVGVGRVQWGWRGERKWFGLGHPATAVELAVAGGRLVPVVY